MHKILIILAITPSFIYALYNPFFNENKVKKAQEPAKEVVINKIKQKPISVPTRKNINMIYYGFVESRKGFFALVSFNERNIIVRNSDSLYLNEQVFKVKKITSNYIILTDRHRRAQTVYFSSSEER